MPTPFANLEAKLNSACRDNLANVEAVIGAFTVSGIFRMAYAEELRGLAGGSQPTFECVEADAGSVAAGDTLTIGSTPWTGIGIEPSGDGWLRLLLQRAA